VQICANPYANSNCRIEIQGDGEQIFVENESSRGRNEKNLAHTHENNLCYT
jgi:hypothetical protein